MKASTYYVKVNHTYKKPLCETQLPDASPNDV